MGMRVRDGQGQGPGVSTLQLRECAASQRCGFARRFTALGLLKSVVRNREKPPPYAGQARKSRLGGRLGSLLLLICAQCFYAFLCADRRALRLHWSLRRKWVSVTRQAAGVLHQLRLFWRWDIGVLAFWIG